MLQWLCALKSPADAAEKQRGLWIGPHQISQRSSEHPSVMDSYCCTQTSLSPDGVLQT